MINVNSSIPVYYQLKEEIKAAILNGYVQPGEKLPSEAEMVRQYGIGRLTIREALSHLVNEGFVEKQHGKGTFCLGIPATGKKKSVDVLLNSSDHYFIPYYVRGISEVLNKSVYDFVFHNTKDSTKGITEILQAIQNKETSGLIIQAAPDVIPFPKEMDDLLRKFRSRAIPYIMIDNKYDAIDASYVVVDYRKGGAIATQHMLDLGHRRVAGIFLKGNRESISRKQGFLTVLHQANLLGKPDIINLETKHDMEALSNQLSPMLKGRNRITAAVCYNDEIALLCSQVIREMGMTIPDDFSIIGFDDSYIAKNAAVPLTSIDHPKEKLAIHATEKLLDLINGTLTWPYRFTYEPGLIERNSTSAI